MIFFSIFLKITILQNIAFSIRKIDKIKGWSLKKKTKKQQKNDRREKVNEIQYTVHVLRRERLLYLKVLNYIIFSFSTTK